MKLLAVGGTFDESGGKPSVYMAKLFSNFVTTDVFQLDVYNGGHWNAISSLVGRLTKELAGCYDVILWFPNIPNNLEKLVPLIKKYNQKSILVTSKNNMEAKYTMAQLVQKALANRSNLVLEFPKSKSSNNLIANIFDPLGNIWLTEENDIYIVAKVLKLRIDQLIRYTRVGSVSIGDAVPIPGVTYFFDIIKQYADVFHELIHGANSERLLGNASFRCLRGFPSFRDKDRICVSRRNIDKRYIGQEGFVAVDLPLAGDKVRYYGKHKPSVDTPIQLKLYEHFDNINFMLHSHVYVDGAKITNEVTPCGAMEEVDEIKSLFDKDTCAFAVNLRGHGSLIAAKTLDYFKDTPYVSRFKDSDGELQHII